MDAPTPNIGRTSCSIRSPSSPRALRRSYSFCKPSQKSELFPKSWFPNPTTLEQQRNISGVISIDD